MKNAYVAIAICVLLMVCYFELQRIDSLQPGADAAGTPLPAAEAEPFGSVQVGELRVRQPAVAGSFYPRGGESTVRMVNGFLEGAGEVKVPGEVVALIAPHAGYVYSGPVAAYAYRAVQGKQYDTVVIVGASHSAAFSGAVVPEADAWNSPLSAVSIDQDLARQLIAAAPQVRPSDSLMAKEHSIEVHLPFAQLALGSFKLLPVQIGRLDARGLSTLAETLARVLEGKRALLIASTDLSHYPAYEDARRVDAEIVEMLEHWRLADLLTAEEHAQDAGVTDLHCRMCGVTAVVTVMQAAALLGAKKVTVLRYANSGDVPEGDKARCVGYCAAALTKTQGAQPLQMQPIAKETSAMTTPPEDQELNEDQQAYVLELAKRAIDSYVIRREKVVPERREGILGQKRAVFVTLNENGRLRGCIGSLEPQEPLVDAVVSRAIAASTQDPRFRPVERGELPKLEIHVSVLSPLRQVSGPSEIEIGRHGIIVRQGFRSGVFLPEVATEQGWDLDTTLNHLCEGKAGLPADAWRRGADLYVFTTQSIGQE